MMYITGDVELCVYAACRFDQFECMNGTCIRMHQRCDGVVHCANGEDELNCTRTGEFLSTHTRRR